MIPSTQPARTPTRLESISDRHRRALWRYLRVLGASSEDAEDLAQEAFVVALRRPDFDDTSPAAVFAFLRTTARLLWLRSSKRTLDTQQIAEADAVWDRQCSDDGGDDYVDALRSCIATLPPKSQQLLRAIYTDGDGRDAAGARFGLSRNGVKSALRRLRARLHKCITHRLEASDIPPTTEEQ